MVSHFGEVIFPSSRAFWDDEDEYELTDNTENSLKMEEVCIIENENHKRVSVIYEINKQAYMCIVLPQFDTKNAGKLVNKIYDLLLSSENVISIVCRHISQFQNTSIPDTPSFLRILATTTANVTKCEIKPLEQPNIVFGVGAGVLSYAELMGIPAKLYILYIDSFVLDSKCAEPILQVLTEEMPCKLQPHKFTENPFSKGNLYM
ncbi:uncharacterized protein LOC105839688 isoform X2 [Monomorium pharaonis]|uniref:uncharacterized protein LOC105839688 isoform X2 n=1 Tax=Monomorium pharaonis TaxID=307658 RepID=UPI0017463C1B|nr:uncharacterized protein LOC105839688 isoform X2 [Monomorium pharaonis]XP_036147155.1 uncharacterized protein LOC105839688 isoform X2 [Monomorium pharaonis]